MKRFEIGKTYEAADMGIDPITVTKRTAVTIWVKNGFASWKMRVREDDRGEYAVDSTVPKRWRDAVTYRPIWET